MMKKKNKNNIKGLLIYTLILFFSIVGFVYTVSAVTSEEQIIATGGDTTSEDGVTISKVISESDTENFFDITLTVETTSQIKNITTYPDLAVVIVMDISNTMTTKDVPKSAGSTEYMSRLDAAQAAAESFIDMFAEEAAKTPAIREIGFVAFNTDANMIFDLQDCENLTQAGTLKDTMNTKTDDIALASNYASTHNRFTNIEAGLYRAKQMLSQSTANNKFIIFLSDGLPTTYLNKTNDTSDINDDENYDGYDPYMSGSVTESKEGWFYNEKIGTKNTYGTSYSDRGAIKAREMASSIKNSGISIYTIGTGIDKQKTVEYYYNYDVNHATISDAHSLVDIEKDATTYEVGETTWSETNTNASRQPYKDWLKKSIGSNVYYDTTDAEGLREAYNDIFKTIQEKLQSSTEASWVANDPMGALVGSEKIEFVGFYDDASPSVLHDSLADYNSDGTDNTTQSDTATFNSSSSAINWDLKNSTYDSTRTETTENGSITYYKYILKYRVRLKNEISNFIENNEYKTNGTTSLKYAVLEETGVLSSDKILYFKEPSVEGYLGELKLYKVSAFDNKTLLTGAKFKLVHDPKCECEKGYLNFATDEQHVHIDTAYATSDVNGEVIFTNIPSGHTYILSEVTAPNDFISTKDTYTIKVAYDNTTGGPSNGTITNAPQESSLEIKKTVLGTDNYKGKFSFDLTVYYNKALLTGTYDYTLNGESTGTITFENGKTTIELGAGDSMLIKGIPVGSTYSLTETTTNGFKVQYKINTSNEVLGDTATCNSLTSCRIESGSTNVVEFINTAGYILPATGSRGMLILIITSLVFLLVPVINIAYTFFKDKRKIS